MSLTLNDLWIHQLHGPIAHQQATLADLIEILPTIGAEMVTDVGYGLQIDSDEGDTFLVLKVDE